MKLLELIVIIMLYLAVSLKFLMKVLTFQARLALYKKWPYVTCRVVLFRKKIH